MVCCLAPLAAAAEAPVAPTPEAALVSLWRALSNEPDTSADVPMLVRLFHADAVVFGSRYREGKAQLTVTPAAKFIESQSAVNSAGFFECEIHREIRQYDRFATAYSVVESRKLRAAEQPDFTDVNSIQLYRGDGGWKIISLYFQVEVPALAVPRASGISGKCLDG
ncbi:MAG TPA: hypothetical protein VFS58_17420 [Steroidobacteraceae bacterium]|nr:hypothetical protein [Steroidobacteraceae bacterium]